MAMLILGVYETDEGKGIRFLMTIPRGKVTTYGHIALYLGSKSLARTVGNILHNNPDPGKYPCHRVVNSKGRVAVNYAFGGAAMQRLLLEQEGIVFKPDGSIDLKMCHHMK